MSFTAPVTFISNNIKILKQYRKASSLDMDKKFMVVRCSVFSVKVLKNCLDKTVVFCFTHQVARDLEV